MTPGDKPQTAAGYPPEALTAVREACLWLATILGDYMGNRLVVVGGLVPALLVDQESLPPGAEPHPGTLDLDVALQLGVLEEEQYREISRRLREAGCKLDANENKNPTVQRWTITGKHGKAVLLEFLIAPASDDEEGGQIKHIEEDFGAVVTPGLELAFRDRVEVRLSGQTIHDEEATRDVSVCGPGAFVVLKALAFRNRGSRKDAFDLHYVIRNHGEGVQDVASALGRLLDEPIVRAAVEILRADFTKPTVVGVMRAAEFAGRTGDEGFCQDIVGDLTNLLDRLPAP